jgi:radical SAM superfamily enzyme YgiQ (UPF0313 family)
MARVCLISAPTANDFQDPELAEMDAIRVIAEHAPLGILSLAAVLEQHGVTPTIVDLNRLYYDCLRSEEYRRGATDFCAYAARYFQSQSFDIYGFSTICSSYPLTLRIAAAVKRTHPAASILLGGPQASVVDVATMKSFPAIDLIVRGEAEATLVTVLEALDGRGSLEAVSGITYRRGAEIVRNANAAAIADLDSLPFPAFHLYPYMHACKNVPLELGRGCPFACTFCSTNDFFRRRFRLKSPRRMIADMTRIRETYGIVSFDLVHDMFTVDRKRVVAFCEALLESGEKFHWGCSARTDCIDDELVELMAHAGCEGIFFGIETGSQRMQTIIDKGLDLAEAAARVETTDRFKITTAVSLITGFPEETRDDLKGTVDFFMDALRFDYADPQLCLLAPLAETPVHSQHLHHLIFDDVISDMSFQGWVQDPLDRAMIAQCPEIFPNFYSVPTPHLDRQFLKELREFLLSGMSTFRWLLLGLHQAAGSVLDVVDDWTRWRRERNGAFSEGASAKYYASPEFHRDFLEFVRTCYLDRCGEAAVAISALVAYEAAFEAPAPCADASDEARKTPAPEADFGGLISQDTVPLVADGITVSELGADYPQIVRCLRRKVPLHRIRKRKVTLVTRETEEHRTELLQISQLSAELLQLCGERRTVRQVADHFSARHTAVRGVPPEKACVVGLEMLRRQGLVVITAGHEYAHAGATEEVHSRAIP